MGNFKQYANSFQAKSRLGLESIGALTEKLGNPQNCLRFIHVAGTNGKGSVCAFLQCILTDSGLKTGKFISPNMIDVCERISVDGKDISNEELNNLLNQVEAAAKKVENEKGAMPTQFEIWTATAFLYFKEKKCDIVVLETGLGGRLDATNIIDSPELCLITKIDIDHTEYLGDTIEKIAAEKAGIIKEGTTVISARQNKKVHCVLENTAKEKNCPFIVAEPPKKSVPDGMGEVFDYKVFKNLKISLAGVHQTENAALAIEAAISMGIDEKYIRSGILRARNIGRFEKISDDPMVIFDGAHNLSGTSSLISAISRYLPDEKLSVIYAAMADKDIDASLDLFKKSGFCEKARFFTVTVEDNPRAEKAERLAQKLIKYGFTALPCENIAEAYKKAILANKLTVICGSLYLYKDFMQMRNKIVE